MPPALPTVNPLAILFIVFLMAAVVGSWVWAALRFAFGAPILPRFTPRVVPWGGRSVLAVVLAWLAVQVGVQYAYLAATRGFPIPPKGERTPFDPAEMMTASAVQNAAVLVVIPLLLAATCRACLRDYVATGRRAGREALQGAITWPLVAPVVYGMMLVAVAIWGKESHPLETAIQNEGVGGKAVIFFLAGAVLAPAAEELIFRGVLLGWLTSLVLRRRAVDSSAGDLDAAAAPVEPIFAAEVDPTPERADRAEAVAAVDPYVPPAAALGPGGPPPAPGDAVGSAPGTTSRLVMANLLVSLLFAALHYTVWPTPVPIFFLSLALGLLYQRTGSLIAPTALHMTFNGISTILMFLTIGSNPHPAPGKPAPVPIPKPVDPITKPPVASSEMVRAPQARPAGCDFCFWRGVRGLSRSEARAGDCPRTPGTSGGPSPNPGRRAGGVASRPAGDRHGSSLARASPLDPARPPKRKGPPDRPKNSTGLIDAPTAIV